MEVILLAIYSFFVWLIFFKFKWLPWNIYSQVTVVMIPIVAMAILILTLNIVAPSSSDVRVINYAVNIVPQVAGRVIEVPIEPNRHIKKGEVLFRIDPTNYELRVKTLEARLPEARAALASATAFQRELYEQLNTARGKSAAISARLELARERVKQTQELAETGAGPVFDFEQAQTDVSNLESELEAARAAEAQVQQKLSARVDSGQLAEIAKAESAIAQLEAQIAEANWQLDQTTVHAPSDGTVVNLQLREGAYTVAFPISPAMTFVEDEQWLLAFYSQNELRAVEEGNVAEVHLKTYPNRIIKCKVDSIIWASGQGQLPIAGMVPDQQAPPNRFPVRLIPDDSELFLAAGARGGGAIYTNSGKMLHIIRMVMMRVSTKLDWFIPKLH